jgi:hypothetical protein
LNDVNAEIKAIKGSQGEASQALQRMRKRENVDGTTHSVNPPGKANPPSRIEATQEGRKDLLKEQKIAR